MGNWRVEDKAEKITRIFESYRMTKNEEKTARMTGLSPITVSKYARMSLSKLEKSIVFSEAQRRRIYNALGNPGISYIKTNIPIKQLLTETDCPGKGQEAKKEVQEKPGNHIGIDDITKLINDKLNSSKYKITEYNLGRLIWDSEIFHGVIQYNESTRSYSANKMSLERILEGLKTSSLELIVRKYVYGDRSSEARELTSGIKHADTEWYKRTAEKLDEARKIINLLEKWYGEGELDKVKAKFPKQKKKWENTVEKWLPLAETTPLEKELYEINQHYKQMGEKL